MSNPFYCTDKKKYTEDGKYSIMDVKTANNTILLILHKLFINNGNISALKKEAVTALENRTAFRVNANHCSEKMEFLIKALRNADNRDIFTSSPVKAFMDAPYAEGYTSIEKKADSWENYKQSKNCEVSLAKFDTFTAATYIDRQDRVTPLGLDVPKILDLIVKKGPDGKYYINDKIDETQKTLLLEATELQLQKIKRIPRFGENFERKPIENENEGE